LSGNRRRADYRGELERSFNGPGTHGPNLTDEEYFTQKLDFGVFALAAVGPPREYGVDFTVNW